VKKLYYNAREENNKLKQILAKKNKQLSEDANKNNNNNRELVRILEAKNNELKRKLSKKCPILEGNVVIGESEEERLRKGVIIHDYDNKEKEQKIVFIRGYEKSGICLLFILVVIYHSSHLCSPRSSSCFFPSQFKFIFITLRLLLMLLIVLI